MLEVNDMNIEVKVGSDLLKKEESRNGTNWLKGTKPIERESLETISQILKAYKSLLMLDLPTDIAISSIEDDVFSEYWDRIND